MAESLKSARPFFRTHLYRAARRREEEDESLRGFRYVEDALPLLTHAYGEPITSMSATLGIVSARVHAEHGYFGGYLVLNHRARPLEFHCTLPVKPSRAQVLLYGPTLEHFVCGEQIAKALINKAKIKPDLILVDSTATLAVSHVSDLAVAKLSNDIAASSACRQLTLPVRNADDQSSSLSAFNIGEYHFVVANGNRASKEFISDIVGQLASHVDLREPFQRIAEALVEAHPVAKAG